MLAMDAPSPTDGTLPMLVCNVYKRSPWRAHAIVMHVDYKRWPSRSWVVAEVDVPLVPGWRASDVAAATGLELTKLGFRPEVGTTASVVDGEQLELPLLLEPRP